MTVRRAIRWSAFAAAALLSLSPSAATAQSGISDVIMAGRVHGAELPPATIEWMRAQGPNAFEFEARGVWKDRVARISERRAAFDAANRERPTRGAAAVVTTTDELQAAAAVLDGTFRMPILLGLPSGSTAPYTTAAYQERMFGAGATGYSLTTFYDEMSGGLFDFTGDVFGWGTLSQNSAYYYNHPIPSSPDAIFGRTPEFLQATVAAVDGSVDFGLYDSDGPDGVPNSGDDDGYVDLAAFMYPAHGRECGSGAPGIWAHRFRMSGWGIPNYVTNDASAEGGSIRVRDYIIQGGLDCDGASLQQIGVVAHEAGHGFGLPDLYDTDATTNVSNGIGHWGLMGAGNWNVEHSPAHMEAHSKAFLGWIAVTTIVRDTALTIAPIFNSRMAYRINLPNASNEYFLLENRQRLGSEVYLHGTGLLIWHVDSVRYEERRAGNTVNADANHKGLDLEEADGLRHLDLSSNAANNRGDAGDPWPGTSNRTTFDNASNPSSETYGDGASNIAITDIVETAGGDITAFINMPDMVTFGDVNGDDAVTSADLDIVMSYTIGATGPDYSTIMIGDVDDDDDVDTVDALVIHAFLERLDTSGYRVGTVGFD